MNLTIVVECCGNYDPDAAKSLIFWRPRRDLNPCYRRERALIDWITWMPLAASGNNRAHRVHFQGRWFPSRMGFGRDGNLHVMAE
jgi:hypothetical protein